MLNYAVRCVKVARMQTKLQFGVQPVLGEERVLRPGKWRWARTLGWMVAMVFVIALTFGPATEALAAWLPKQAAYRFLAHLAGAAIVLIVYPLLVRLGERRMPDELAPARAPAGIVVGTLIGLAMFSVVMAIMIQAGLYDFTWHGVAPAWRGVGLAIQSAVLEEVIIRGVILRLLWRAFGPTVAFVVSAALFGAGHIANPGATLFTTACVAIEAGIMLGSFYALTGRLWVSIGVHAGWNFTQGYLFGARVSGSDFGPSIATTIPRPNLPDWLTGGAFGPEASLPAFVVCTAVGVLVLWLAWRAGRFSGSHAT